MSDRVQPISADHRAVVRCTNCSDGTSIVRLARVLSLALHEELPRRAPQVDREQADRAALAAARALVADGYVVTRQLRP